ncbi:MAG TPA: glucose-1-phosphate adenylyltransferase [Acidimicrobiia bacterium]|nr:glucose-1-phosphate adenylyltransferase [Acidimicrobiia bacterium]
MSRPQVLSMVLAGGEGKRLMPLTQERAKPAVPFGGHYRLIDFALSNLVNAGYRRIVVLTQYKSHSLNVHLSLTWRMSTLLGNYVTSVPAQMRVGQRWFLGSADAIYQNLNIVSDEQPDYIFVFGADHIYRMDPSQMLEAHIESGAGATVAAIRVPRSEGSAFGIIQMEEGTSRIARFWEKPEDPPALPGDPEVSLASMGNYVFTTEALLDQVRSDAGDDDSRHDVGGDLIPSLVEKGIVHCYDFTHNVVPGLGPRERGYWRDVGTIDSYFEAHMDLVSAEPIFSLYNDEWPIFTQMRTSAPAKIVAVADHGAGGVADSVLSNGVILSGAYVRRTVASPGVRIAPGASVDGAILLDDVKVGAGAVLRNVIVDKNVVIPPGYEIGVDHARDAERFMISEGGVVAVAKNQVIGGDQPAGE